MPQAKKRITTIRLAPELLTRLSELAGREGLPRSRLVEHVLTNYAREQSPVLDRHDAEEGPFE